MTNYAKYFLFCLLLSLVGRTGILNSFRDVVQKITFPLQYGLYKTASNFAGEYAFITNLKNVQTQLTLSKRNEEQLVSAKVRIAELEEENNALKNQLSVSVASNQKPLPVRIFGFVYGGGDTILISGGSQNGVQKGYPLVYGKYLIGTVTAVYAQKSEVALINSPDTKILVVTQEGNARGIISRGLGLNVAMKNILLDENIKSGDTILTSGENELIPYGLIIGKVDNVNTSDKGVLKEAIVTLTVDPRRIETAFVLIK